MLIYIYILCIGLDNGLVPNRPQAIIWTNVDLLFWRIREDELIHACAAIPI